MTAPRRILLVNHVSRISGAERSLLDLAGNLDRARFEPLAVVPPAPDGLPAALDAVRVPCRPLPLRRIRRTVNPLRLTGLACHVAVTAARMSRLIRRERIALVHANSNTAQLYAGLAARWAGVPCIWHTRDLVPLGPLAGWMAYHAACIVAISDCVHRHVARHARGVTPVRIVHNGIVEPAPVDAGARGACRSALGVPPDAPLIGMVGQLVPWKNHAAFLAMAARVAAMEPRAWFVVVGGDLFGEHADYRKSLERLVADMGLGDRCTFPGHRNDVAAVMAALDILVHPATREPLGRVILEAMAAGLPVVAVNACGPAEVVRDGIDGLLTADAAPAELAGAVLRLLGDPALAARLGSAARQRVAERFRLQDTVRHIESLYDAVLRREGGPCA